MLVDDRTSAEVDRTGAVSLPLVVICLPSWNISSRATCGLYVAKLRVSSPSQWWRDVFPFASMGRWQPPQLVVQPRWQGKQAIGNRKRVVWGKSVFVRVYLGGRRILKKKKKNRE